MAQQVISKEQGSIKTLGIFSYFKNGILGLQHLVAMFGATILVPLVTGLDPSVAFYSQQGIGTLIFHLCTKGKVPVFLGSSFAFIPVIQVIATKYGDLRYAQGGIFFAGLAYVLISFGIKKLGVDKIKRFLPNKGSWSNDNGYRFKSYT